MGTKPPPDKPTLTDVDRRRLAAATITNADRIGAVPPRREFLQALAGGFLATLGGKGAGK